MLLLFESKVKSTTKTARSLHLTNFAQPQQALAGYALEIYNLAEVHTKNTHTTSSSFGLLLLGNEVSNY